MFKRSMLMKVSYRSADTWALLSMWLSVMHAVTYGQTAMTKAAINVHMSVLASHGKEEHYYTFFRFFDEIGLLLTNVVFLLLACLMVAVLKPRWRVGLSCVNSVASLAIAFGFAEKIVFAKWWASNETMLSAEAVRQSGVVAWAEPTTWLPSLGALGEAGAMMVTDLAIIVGACLWALWITTSLSARRISVS